MAKSYGRSDSSITSESHTTVIRDITFSSSRMLPGQR